MISPKSADWVFVLLLMEGLGNGEKSESRWTEQQKSNPSGLHGASACVEERLDC
jgi:hypothetical protein